MKILEAGAIGVPVVSTNVGAEGLPVVDGENILLADTPEMFTKAILRLEDYEIRESLSKQLHKTIRTQYSVDALCENRRILYI
jgi:glycosyltransferase involved in cell wall biosynthesis